MKLRLSRHARNNMRLYGIFEVDLIEAIQKPNYQEKEGQKTVVLKKFKNRFSGFPLKIVYQEKAGVFVITIYPLKKSFERKI